MGNAEVAKALLEPFAPEKIRWRIRTKLSGEHAFVLAYIDARDVMDRLDEVFGVGRWSRKQQIVNGNHICSITVNYWDSDHEQWFECTMEDVAEPTDIEAQKGGASDSFKRAAVNLGINRVCYTLGDTKVKLEQGYIPDYEKKRLREEVLIPAYKKFAEEYGLDAKKWVVKPAAPSPKTATEIQAQVSEAISDGDLLKFLIARRQQLWAQLGTIYADSASPSTHASAVIKKVSDVCGTWDSLDIYGKIKYVKLLSDEVAALNKAKKPLPLGGATLSK